MNKPIVKSEIDLRVQDLKTSVNNFISFFKKNYNYQTQVNTHWSAKDILGHITFWHESFARNIQDLGNGVKPTPLKGKLSEVNDQSVETTRPFTIPELIDRLRTAQKTIEKHITNEKIGMIPYKKGSRDYSRLEHVEIVTQHINKHLVGLKKELETSGR